MAPPNGHMDCSGLVTNETCSFSCDIGYQIQGSARRKCQIYSTWDGQQTLCKGAYVSLKTCYILAVRYSQKQVLGLFCTEIMEKSSAQ